MVPSPTCGVTYHKEDNEKTPHPPGQDLSQMLEDVLGCKWFGLCPAGLGRGYHQAWCVGTASRGHVHHSTVRAVPDTDRLWAEGNIDCDLSGCGWIVIDDVGGLFL